MRRQKKTKRLLIIFLVLLLVLVSILFLFRRKVKAPTTDNIAPASKSQSQAHDPQPAGLDKKKYSIDQPDSLWVVVNKQRPLPANYSPARLVNSSIGGQMRPEASQALNNLAAAAKKDGVNLKVISAYRSYGTQQATYSGYVKANGQAAADTFSARAGHSEHQTGLAVDLGRIDGKCELDICFGDTLEGKWLAAHAQEYGFIIRYQKDTRPIVGYQYEPWHIRYVGTELSNELNKTNQTMEEFFGLPAAPAY